MNIFEKIVFFFRTLSLRFTAFLMGLIIMFGYAKAPPVQPEIPDDSPIITRAAMADTYAATDALSRELPGYEEAGEVKKDKFVGLFYWTWHVSHSKWVAESQTGHAINVNDIVTRFPNASHDLNFSEWGSIGLPHHWNEPLFGYYDTDDEWVLRKHAEMLANAGVDVIICDNTNGTFTWKDSYDILFEVFAQARSQGVKTPQVAFMLPFGSGENANTQLRMLYDDIYSKNRYQDLWFYWEGKPLIMAHPDELNLKDEKDMNIRAFFTYRPGQPSYTAAGEAGKWGWLSVYPQAVYPNLDGTPEQITVGVAMNHSAEKGLTAMNGENVFGRTYTSKGVDTRENAKLYGANFEEQWEYALKIDPEFVFITGFNEWVAGRHEEWMGVTNAFPDQYNDTYSRDIEPSKGELGDNYYYQMCKYIRLFKGVNKLPDASQAKSLDIAAAASQWDDVQPSFYAYEGNTFARDNNGYGIQYTDNTGRNDITLAKVARDADNVYFMVETKDELTDKSGNAWMRLFISTGKSDKSWEGYDYIINRNSPMDKALLEKSSGGWNWDSVCEVDYTVQGNVLQIKVPKAMLGIDSDAFQLNFKWSDNMQNDGDIYDFYLYGDTAPLGRFMYQYRVN